MLRQSRRRNRNAVDAGRVTLVQGDVSAVRDLALVDLVTANHEAQDSSRFRTTSREAQIEWKDSSAWPRRRDHIEGLPESRRGTHVPVWQMEPCGIGHGSLERRAPPVRRDGQVSAPRAHAGPGDRRPEQCRAGLRLGRDAGRPLCQRRRLWLRWRVGAMSRLRHTESARIGGEGRRFAVTSEPTDSHDRLTSVPCI